jgi:cyclopropane fatty-acyl-phospholipid synthase-like methyltransferase
MGKKKGGIAVPHRHLFYEAAVQNVDADLDFAVRVYRKRNGRRFRRVREDFCGTAALACCWAGRRKDNLAWGVDLDEKTLAWGRERHLLRLGDDGKRVTLVLDDVRTVKSPAVDVIMALNFSYFVFKARSDLLEYFRHARKSLRRDGLLVLDLFGGPGSMEESVEKTKHRASEAADGTRIPPFTYVWDQARFNPVNHHILCHIHFKPHKGRLIKKAFTYDWRLWTLPEIADLLAEAGFRGSEVYTEGWDEETDEADGIFRKKSYFENDESWIAYIVAYR